MVAALEPLRAQEIRDLVGAGRQRRKRKSCLLVAAGIDDPQRGAIAAHRIMRELRVEPVQRPVERHRLRPAETLYRGIVVGTIFQKKSARFLESGHRYFPARLRTCWIIPEKSLPPLPAASNA